ncbi:Pentatricopeptide repeat [Trinorchestia longiramus]|nr:Pentatricopeptide repeat [Trinorchestia longiramus]
MNSDAKSIYLRLLDKSFLTVVVTGELQSNEEPVAQDVEDVVGRFLLDISQRSGSASEDFDWVALLTALKERGLSISKEREASLSYALGRRATSEVNTLLSCLASGTLKKVQLERRPQFLSYNKISVEQLEEALGKCTESGRDPKPILINLLIVYCNADELEKANNVLKMLEETHQFPVGVGLRVHLINLYHKTNQPQLAFDMLEKIKEIEPDALLTSKAILKIANLYVDADRIEDAAVFLETEAKKRHASGEKNPAPEGKDHGIDLLCNRILTPSSESGDVEMVSRLERAILDGQFAAPSRRLINPIVRAYLVKGDLDAAWASVVECKRNYNIIPFRKGIAKELIKREDTNKLQQLVDMATDLYGEHNSLFDLACFFVDEERVKEAKRVLETPGLRVRSESVSEVCKYYLREKQTKRIEDLLAASAGTSIDRRFVYEYLLEAYINDGNCDKALGLWTQMQEEDLPASDKFLRDLGSFLQQNDKPVPFAIPEEEKMSQRARLQPQQEMKKAPELQQPRHPKLLEYEKLLEDGKLDEALSLHTELLSAEDEDLVLKPRHSFTLAKKLLDVGRLDDTIKIFQESPAMRKRNSGLLRTIAKRLAELNDYDRFEDFFTNYRSQDDGYLAVQLCKTAGRSNQAERCFNTIEKILNEVSYDTKPSSHLFPSSGLLWLVKKDPSLMTRLETLSDKMKSKGVVKGIETLWGYHFIEGNTEEAKKLSEEVKDGNAFDLCVPVLHYCRETQDVLVAQNLLSYIKGNLANSDTAVAATYNCIIDILCQKNKPREALKTLEETQKSINLKSINAATLKTLSEQLAAENIKFPFEIPAAATTLRPGVSHRK